MPKNESKLTTSQIAAYIEKPNRCPYCESYNIDAGGGTEIEDNICTVYVTCDDCKKSWTDVYRLVDMKPDKEDVTS